MDIAKKTRRSFSLWALCLLLGLFPVSACAQDAAEASGESLQQALDGVFDSLDFSAASDITLAIPGFEEGTGIEQVARAIASGESVSADELVAAVLGAFWEALSGLGKLMLAIMLPVLLSGMLSHTLAGRKDSLEALCRSVCFVLILVPVVVLVIEELEHTRETIVTMTHHMQSMLPMLLTLLTAVGGSASSAFLHPMVVAASGSMVFLAREVILRLVMCTCAVTAVNHLSDRAHLTRMAQLLRGAACWLLGVSFTVFLGAMSLQGIASASIDGVAIRAAKYAVDNFVPVVGGMFSDTMDTLVGCTLIVKNALGVAAVFALGSALMAPMARTLAVIFVLRLSAALLEPVADSDIVHAIGDFSKTIVLFFITMLCVGTMYFLLIVQVLLVGNLTVMLR